jgi:TolB-like protein
LNFLNELRRRSVLRVAAAYLVTGWLVMQITGVIETAAGLPSWADGVALIILLAGFPIALIIAWAFELTPDGFKRTDTTETAQDRSGSYQIQDLVLIASLVLVAMLMLGNRFFPGETAPVETVSSEPSEVRSTPNLPLISDSSIAVLAFDDLSPAGDQEYFSDGIAEEILNVLVRVEELDVASRTSAFQFKSQPDLGIPQIAQRLNVRHVVEGSVRRDGDTIRITAQLIDASDDRHLWSETYDAALTTGNLFAIQDEIATAIVEALQEALGLETVAEIEVEATTDNFSAYELYLQARALFQHRLDLDVANALLGRVVELDANFSEAWELRAASQLVSPSWGHTPLTERDSDALAGTYAHRALEIEPDSVTAIAVLAFIRMGENVRLEMVNDWSHILNDLNRALEIDPRNPEALNWVALTYANMGSLHQALQAVETCSEYEPLYMPCRSNIVSLLSAMGREDEALEAAHHLLSFETALAANLTLFARAGEEWAFSLILNDSSRMRGWPRISELYEAYQNPEADHRELVADARRFSEGENFTYIFGINELLDPITSDGFEGRIDRSFAIRKAWLPEMAHYRHSEAFKSQTIESGVLAYWQVYGFPPQCRAVGADDFECD